MRKHLCLFALALVALLCATACDKDEEVKLAPEMDSSQIGAYEPITQQQYDNRMILQKAMVSHGFKIYDYEWWHFTLKDEPFPNTYFNFPVATWSINN